MKNLKHHSENNQKHSQQWDNLISDHFLDINDNFLKCFRKPGRTNKFVSWDPFEKSTRYLKFLLYNTANQMTDSFFEAYSLIKHTDLGEPLSIRYKNCDINADYLASVEEWSFLTKNNIFEAIDNITEIGGGFGRTCHTLLALEQISSYTIIDLDPMLELSKSYLFKVLPDDLFSRINFVSNTNIELQESIKSDLTINIDSFQEMPTHVIDQYMERSVNNSKFFYSKNAVGKYNPSIVGMPDADQEKIQDVFHLGRCRNVIDIFNNHELKLSSKDSIQKYMPNSETPNKWTFVDGSPMIMFQYFFHALYRKI
jgi:putative sugar O-methyltransferase